MTNQAKRVVAKNKGNSRLGFEEPIPMTKPSGELGVMGALSLYNQLTQNLREYRAAAAAEPTDIGYFNLY